MLIKLQGQYLLNLVTDRIRKLTDEIVIATSPEQYAVVKSIAGNERIVVDLVPGRAAMGGIYTGLHTARNTLCLVVGCDMPLLNLDLIQYMIDEVNIFDIVVPRIGQYVEPLHAIYSKNCMPIISDMIEKNNLKIYELLNRVNTRYISDEEIDRFDPQHMSIFNINTREAFDMALVLMKRKKHD